MVLKTLGTASALLMIAVLVTPAAAAHARPRVDFEVGVDVDLTVVARILSEADAELDFEYEWEWGDGEASAGAEASHAYAEPGEYEVTLKLTDEGGRCWRETRSVEVRFDSDGADDEAREPDGEREDAEERPARRQASASARLGGISAAAEVAWGRASGEDEDREESSASARVRAQSDREGRHDAPAPGFVAGLAVLGLAAWLGRRRR